MNPNLVGLAVQNLVLGYFQKASLFVLQ
ncbi:hypothetical protein V12B01_13210 [Vibrio splendidus 12B01]|nr:hypothetical protein V12B01_13210 [Vibrio splendidus 12B01]